MKQLCVDTMKELGSLKYIHRDLRLKLIQQLNECTLATPPPHFVAYRVSLFQSLVNLSSVSVENCSLQPATEFDETLYRSGIHLYLAMLPQDTSLLLPLAKAYTKSSTLLKKVW